MPKHLTTDDASDFVTSSVIGQANGVAQLGEDGKVPNSQLPTVLTGSVDSVNGKIGNVALTSADVGAVPLSQKGQPNGVPQLDTTGRMPSIQLPALAVLSTSLGVPQGIATLDTNGKLTAAQTPVAPVTAVNGKTGDVALSATDVSAVPASQRAAANGVASLDGNITVPLSQIPSLVSLYQEIPEATPDRPNMLLAAIAGGSNSTQWVDPMVYVASSAAAMPSTVPTGSLCVRTDILALYTYSGGWKTLVPQVPAWQNLPLPSGTRGYDSNNVNYRPRYRKVGNQAWVMGRIELTNGAKIPTQYAITLPSEITPSHQIDAVGTSTTSSAQKGLARFQISPTGEMVFYDGDANTPWLGFNFTYMID